MRSKAPEALLYDKLEGKAVQCKLCAHRCRIPDQHAGFCQTRFNDKGVLRALDYGKAAGLEIDPIEKKPFFHFYPGARKVLSFGTPGCNFRCKGCFTPETRVFTDQGVLEIRQIFEGGADEVREEDGGLRLVSSVSALTHSGKFRKIVRASKHDFAGELIVVKPFYAPEFKCTPNHEVFALRNGVASKMRADQLQQDDLLLIPKSECGQEQQTINVAEVLSGHEERAKIPYQRMAPIIEEIMELKKKGFTSRQIGEKFGVSGAQVRNTLSKVRRCGTDYLCARKIKLVEKKGRIRFSGEKSSGISKTIILDEDFATLLGYYCAEGYVGKYVKRPNSYWLEFCFGNNDDKIISRTEELLAKFGISFSKRVRGSTVSIKVKSTVLALLFKRLCCSGSEAKRVPSKLFYSHVSVVKSFLRAYNDGDGWNKAGDHPVSMDTVSSELAFGVYALLLKIGILPSFYLWKPAASTVIQGRTVTQSNLYYVKVHSKKFKQLLMGEQQNVAHAKAVLFQEDLDYFYIPIKSISHEVYAGPVYNLEVERDHSYLANFVSVGNCQNWNLSQLPRLEKNPFEAMPTITPKQIVAAGAQEKVDGFAYTYTEPTIFFEYARDTILEARKKMSKAFHTFVSNGYFSLDCFKQIAREKLLDAIRIDLKFIDDDKYKEYCSAHLEPVQESIIRVYNAKPKIHLEVINLVVPGWNDDADSLRRTAEWIAGVGKDIPTHFIRFFPMYEAQNIPATDEQSLLKAKKIAEDAGLEYVFAGNTLMEGVEDTRCPQCGKLLVKRRGMAVVENVWEKASAEERAHPACPKCGRKINIVL